MQEEDRDRLLEWLLAHGGPVVRYRTAVELWPDCPPVEVHRMEQELLAFPLVWQWLDRLAPGSHIGDLARVDFAALSWLIALLHGSQPHKLENVLGRLNEWGLRAGMMPLDERMLPLMRLFQAAETWQADDLYAALVSGIVKSILAWGLLRARYQPSPEMQAYLAGLVDGAWKIAREHRYDLYASSEEKKSLPKAWLDKPVIKREVLFDYRLPLIHDLYVLAYIPNWLLDAETLEKINAIVAYVLHPRFQALQPGYGYAWCKERRTCYSVGWSPHLAGYHGFEWKREAEASGLVQQVELMGRFPAARGSRWFQSALRHLEWFRTDAGTYRFPAHYLRDQTDGYYISGAAMSLGESRRAGRGQAGWLEIESTFRMLKIRLSLPDCLEPIYL